MARASHSAVTAAAELVEAAFSTLPHGYALDKEAATYNDSLTFGEMATSDIWLMLDEDSWKHAFCDLGSGVGKLAVVAASFFRASCGVELAPERALVAARAVGALTKPANLSLLCASFLDLELRGFDVLFCHNLVFTRALSRALEQKLDHELASGAVVFTVAELRFTKRGRLNTELQASYGWAPAGELRPLYRYCWVGQPLPQPEEDS